MPTITHAINGLDFIEGCIRGDKFFANAFEVRRDRIVIYSQLRFAHELIAIFYMAGKFDQCMHHPELRHGQRDFMTIPQHGQFIDIQCQRAAMQDVLRP